MTPAPGDEPAAGRAQDQGRRHRRTAAPSPATRALLTRYRQAQRDELAGLLDELGGVDDPQLTVDGKPNRKRPSVETRAKLWALAMSIARDLGAEIDPMPEPSSSPGSRPAAGGPRRARARDFGGA